MKKINMNRLAAGLLVLVLLTSCFVGSTMARYATGAAGSDTARAAKFGITIEAYGDAFGANYIRHGETNEDKATIDGELNLTVSSGDGKDVVAPGTMGEDVLSFKISGSTEVAVNVTITLNNEGKLGMITLPGGEGMQYTDYTKYTMAATESASGYKTKFTQSSDYNPIKWTLEKDGTAVEGYANVTLAKIQEKFASMSKEYAPNSTEFATICGVYTLSWNWAIGNTQTDQSQAGFENFDDIKFYITDISVHSFNLATRQSIDNETATDVTQKDSTFGISIQLNALNKEGRVQNSSLDLADVDASLSNATPNAYGVAGVELGTGYNYLDNQISLALSHYNTIIDISTERYVDITLQNEYGSMTIIYRVYIHRELTKTDVSTAILQGKYFNNLGGASSQETTVTGNSAVTAGFVINNYISNNFTNEGLYVSLTNGFPAGTGLTLIDITQESAPQYYWYLVPAGGKQKVSLPSFTNMSGSGNFAKLEGDNIDRIFLLIVDFSNVTSPLTGDRTLSMTADKAQGAESDLADITMALMIHFTTIHTFDITGTAGAMTDGLMQLNLTLNSAVGAGYDFLYSGRNDTIKLMFNNLPTGSCLQYNQKDYYPVSEGSGQSFIVDIPAVTGTKTYSMTLHTPYQAVSGNTIAFTAHYMVAAPYFQNQAMGGQSVDSVDFNASVKVNAPVALSLDRKDNHGYHLATVSQISSGIVFEVTRQGAAVGQALNWSVYQKTANGYSLTATKSGTVDAGSSSFNVNFSGATVGQCYRVVLSYGSEIAVFNIIVVNRVS